MSRYSRHRYLFPSRRLACGRGSPQSRSAAAAGSRRLPADARPRRSSSRASSRSRTARSIRASNRAPLGCRRARAGRHPMCGTVCRAPPTARPITHPTSKSGCPTPPAPMPIPSPSSPRTRAAVCRSARRGLGRQAQSTLQGGMERVLRDQPLAVAVAGLAAGAAVAASSPRRRWRAERSAARARL